MSDSSAYDAPRGPLRHRCASCDAIRTDLLRCTGCRIVRYCSREHQARHRPQHKSLCKKMGKLRDKLQREDHAVRHATEDFMTPANAFETHAGHFWGLINTRDYMRARFAVADEARLEGTLDGVTECLEHFQDMIRLCHSDNMGVRDHVPALMLRLDRDQECYDFIKWWETAGKDDHYDWGDMDLPFLNVKDADVMEDPKFMLHRFGDLGFLAAVLLFKVKLLIDIRNIKVARKVVAGRLPVELWREVEGSAVRSPLSRRFVGRDHGDLDKMEHRLMQQCRRIGPAIVATNEAFMYELMDLREQTMLHRPGSYSHGSVEHMILAMHEAYPAWWETVGALELLQDARAGAYKHYSLHLRSFQIHLGLPQGKRKYARYTTDKIWAFLELAVKNGSYLGPPHDRPSERYTREAREALEKAEAEGMAGDQSIYEAYERIGDYEDPDSDLDSDDDS